MRGFGRLIVRVAGGLEEYALGTPAVTIGRSAASDVVLVDPRVSRTHARVECSSAGSTVVDLGSANGTLVNDCRVDRAELHHGDVITIGDTVLRFETAPGETPADVTRLDTSSDVERTLAEATIAIQLNDATRPRIAVHTRDRTWEVPLHDDALTIGRDPSSDLCIDDAAVSRHHARVEQTGDVATLRDLGSTNGTWVGSARVDEVVLRPGRTVRIGGARLTLKPGIGPDDLTVVDDRPARDSRRPVVFVPGLTGSELWRGSERVWPNTRLLLSDPELFRLPEKEPLRAGGVVGEVVIIPNLVTLQGYSRMTDYLVDALGYVRGRDVLEFGYDWRRDVRDSARQLAATIEGWRVAGPITIVAHSLGCLVSRYYVERLGGDRRVGRLVLMGGPHAGTPKALAGLVLGPSILPFGLMGDRIRAVAATFPSSYQILPTYPCTIDEQGRPIDPLDDETWVDDAQRPLLRGARAFWAELGSGSKAPATSVFGYGCRTVTGLRVTRDAQLAWRRADLVHEPSGDCSVPVASALLEGSDMHPVHQEHGALYVDSDVRMRLKLELMTRELQDAGSGDH